MNDVDVGELKMLPAAVGERHRAAAIGRERDPLAVGRPGRPEVAAGAGRQRLAPPASARSSVQRFAVPPPRVLTNTSCLPSGENAA